MRKLLLLLPLVAGSAWAGTTYYSGVQAQPAYDKLLSQLNQLKPLHFESETYESGYMQSTAVTAVKHELIPDEEPLFRLKHVINHSPVGVDAAGTRIGANSVVTTIILNDMSEKFATALGGRDPAVLHTRVDLSGETHSSLQIADITVSDDEATFDFGGGEFNFTSESDGRIHGGGSTKQVSLTLHGSENVVHFAESPLSVDMQYLADGLYTGSFAWNSPSASFTDGRTGQTVSLEQLKISSASSIANNVYGGDAKFSIGKIEAPLPVTAAGLEVTFKGFPVDGIKKAQDLNKQLVDAGLLDGNNEEQLVELMIDTYKSLIAPGAGLQYAASISNQGGDMYADLGFEFIGDGSISGTDNMQTVRDVLNAIKLTANLDADAMAVDMTPVGMLMGHPMAAQYIINDGVKYSSELTVADALLYANGETMDIVEMLGFSPMLDMPLESLGQM